MVGTLDQDQRIVNERESRSQHGHWLDRGIAVLALVVAVAALVVAIGAS
jgi:hypothetical protein